MLIQAISIFGAFCLLLAFFISSMPKLQHLVILSMAFNLLGSGLLAIVAIITLQYGFIILEAAWFTISITKLIQYLRT